MSRRGNMFNRLSGPVLSLLLHGGVAALACVSVVGVRYGGGEGGSGDGSGESFTVTLRSGDNSEKITSIPTSESRAFAPVDSDSSVEFATAPVDLPFDPFSAEPGFFPAPTAQVGEGLPRTSASRYERLPSTGSEPEAQGGGGSSGPIGVGSGLGDGTVEAVGLNTPRPGYPARARDRNIEGAVVAEFTVRADGACDDIRIIESSGHSILDSAVLSAVKKWTYRPSSRSSSQRIRFVFKLSL